MTVDLSRREERVDIEARFPDDRLDRPFRDFRNMLGYDRASKRLGMPIDGMASARAVHDKSEREQFPVDVSVFLRQLRRHTPSCACLWTQHARRTGKPARLRGLFRHA